VYGPAHPRVGGWVQSALTSEKGEWSMRVPPGEHYLYLASQLPAGYVVEQQGGRDVTVATAADANNPIDFLVDRMPGKPVAGRVVGPDGKGVADAIISIELTRGHDFFDQMRTTTDADGKFSIAALPPRSQLRAAGGAGGMRTLNPVKVNGGERDVTIKLAPPVKITLTGRVLDTAGKPLPRAKIALTVWNGMTGLGSGDVSVDADGRYALKNLQPDKKYTLQAKSPGYGSAQTEAKINLDKKALATATDSKASVPLEQAPLVLKRAASFVSGVVVDESGKPVADIIVNVNGRDTAQQSKRSDSNGRFEFADIVDGETISLNAFKDGNQSPETKVPAGSVDVTVTWKEPVKKK
jgi:protocatechuate 3,4-dioxygenase beta subunit